MSLPVSSHVLSRGGLTTIGVCFLLGVLLTWGVLLNKDNMCTLLGVCFLLGSVLLTRRGVGVKKV